eukprot:UN02104
MRRLSGVPPSPSDKEGGVSYGAKMKNGLTHVNTTTNNRAIKSDQSLVQITDSEEKQGETVDDLPHHPRNNN